MDKEIAEDKYEQKIEDRRNEHTKRNHKRIEEAMIDRLFEDRYII